MNHLSPRAQKALRALRTQSPTNLFESPTNIIKPWKAGAFGAVEWQTSTYSFNKQAQKTIPVATAVTEKLLNDYMTVIQGRGTESTGASASARNSIAIRRRSEFKYFVSKPIVKDHGDKLVIHAFVHETGEEERIAEEKDTLMRVKREGAATPPAGLQNPQARDARPRGPVTRANRQPGAQRATGKGR